MKKLICLSTLFLCIQSAFCQAPEGISFQALIRDAQNNLLTDKNIGIQVTIIAGSESGHVVYQETHDAVTNSLGIITLSIGSGNVQSGNITFIKWNMGPYFIKTGIDPSGGNAYSIEAVSEFTTVPYSFYADKAEKVNTPVPEIQTLADVLILGDSAGMQIKNLSDPVDEGDLVTSNYISELLGDFMDSLAFFPIRDIEGNEYQTFRIGNKLWMAENLRTGTYNDGTPIPLVTDAAEWTMLNTAGYCWYDNSVPNGYTARVYGALYNWYTVNTEMLCPGDWRIPDNNEWNELLDYLGSSSEAGSKMKERGTKHWLPPNITDRGISNFKALPGGYRTDDFYGLGYFGKFWSANETSVSSGNSVSLDSSTGMVQVAPSTKKTGLSVRCINNSRIIGL